MRFVLAGAASARLAQHVDAAAHLVADAVLHLRDKVVPKPHTKPRPCTSQSVLRATCDALALLDAAIRTLSLSALTSSCVVNIRTSQTTKSTLTKWRASAWLPRPTRAGQS